MEINKEFNCRFRPTSSFLRAEDYCHQALKLFRDRRWREAQVILEKGLLEVEKSPQAFHLLALALYHQGLFKTSLKYFRKACLKSNEPEYIFNMSFVLNELGHYEDGQKAYDKALNFLSQSKKEQSLLEISEMHQQTAKVYVKSGDLKSALMEYVKSLKFFKTETAQVEIALLLWKLNQKEKAKNYLKKFLLLCPHHVPARFLLADWYFEQKQIDLAVNEWENILRIDKNNRQAYDFLLQIQQFKDCSD